MFEFNRKAEKYLIKAGWYAGRSINITKISSKSRQEGYMLSAVVESFLKQFGLLHIKFLRSDNSTDEMHFDAVKASGGISSEWIKEDYFKRLNNKRLCPIGNAFSNHLTLMMDDEGAVYGGYDDYLCLIAESGEQAIQQFV